jgi:hypothetical protein
MRIAIEPPSKLTGTLQQAMLATNFVVSIPNSSASIATNPKPSQPKFSTSKLNLVGPLGDRSQKHLANCFWLWLYATIERTAWLSIDDSYEASPASHSFATLLP